jgi:AcrR family transcriptional regulator
VVGKSVEKSVRDRRIQKTQSLLKAGLTSLIREKPYDSIAVKEILDRANVGRSTFYMHFRNKDELLVAGIHDMLRSVQSPARTSFAQPHERIISFSLPIFEYHHRHRHAGGDRMGTRGRAILHDHLRKVLAELVADAIRKDVRGRRQARRIPQNLVAEYVASTFGLVLNWWLDSKNPLPPEDINDLFRALVLPTLSAIW